MDFEKLRDLIGKCKTANYQAGLNEGRAEASKEVCKSFDAELDWYLQECEAESRKPIVEVFHAEPLPPPPPTERRCRNCANFLWIPPETRETATSGYCYARNVGTEFREAQSDLDHSWCDMWKPMEEEHTPPPTPAAAGTPGASGTVGAPGPLTPKPVRCAECKHGEISVNEGTATCKKSGVVFEDYSKSVPCGEFEPKDKDEEPEEAKTCGDCKHMGACMATSSRELGQPPPEHAVCELFEAREEDDEPEEPEEDKRCGDCVHYNARKLWCEGHEIPVVASSGACPDYRKKEKK